MNLYIWYNIGGGPYLGADCVMALAPNLREARKLASNPLDDASGRVGDKRLDRDWFPEYIRKTKPDRVIKQAEAVYFTHSE